MAITQPCGRMFLLDNCIVWMDPRGFMGIRKVRPTDRFAHVPRVSFGTRVADNIVLSRLSSMDSDFDSVFALALYPVSPAA